MNRPHDDKRISGTNLSRRPPLVSLEKARGKALSRLDTEGITMRRLTLLAVLATMATAGEAMAQQRIVISSEWGNVSANLSDNDAAQELYEMLPLTIQMSDHLRQEKTGNLPSSLSSVARQREFSKGTLGLWSSSDFVIYYSDGRVPQPGITILGNVEGDVSIFDRPGEISITIQRAE